jgi:outer membrane immunogenic protein
MSQSSKPILALAAILLLAAGGRPAGAADLGRYPSAEPLPPAPVGTTWSGFYIGGNLGAALDPYNLSIEDLSQDQDLSLKFSNDTELVGGVQAGYNWQMGSWVVGVEGDVDFSESVNYLASARGRLGLAVADWLFYGTGGVAFIDTDNNFSVVSTNNGSASFSGGSSDTGYVVGGGIDYKIAPNLSLGAEALYYDFGSETTRLRLDDEPFVLDEDRDFTAVRARLNYHF